MKASRAIVKQNKLLGQIVEKLDKLQADVNTLKADVNTLKADVNTLKANIIPPKPARPPVGRKAVKNDKE